ncbi:hypothetical protein L6164_001195 [Bauhinia variegata]|uniref:Uncharacterized protein n=1 Tax=Bauhinia variegata TaxID=167791 RepID=A0ACB9QA73_BAUVA|nr:hypothetical protein L6164_001195 [Bauhinia variegata]
MLSIIVLSLRQLRKDIHLFLRPLIEDLKILWEEGVDVFDEYRKDSFKMHATIFCTFNDFSKYGNMFGYRVKGHRGKIAPGTLTGDEVYLRVKDINVIFGKTQMQAHEKSLWKKSCIFFDLPYWCILNVRHYVDVMYVEKNVCDNLMGMFLNISGKTKDGVNA